MNNDKLIAYKPQVVFPMDTRGIGYGVMLVQLCQCPCCKQMMFDGFPKWFYIELDAQLKRAKWVKKSDIIVDDKHICVTCEKAGKADFLCALCEQRKPTDKLNDSFGDPAEHLCTDCYETVPAIVWDKKVNELQEEHRYDFD